MNIIYTKTTKRLKRSPDMKQIFEHNVKADKCKHDAVFYSSLPVAVNLPRLLTLTLRGQSYSPTSMAISNTADYSIIFLSHLLRYVNNACKVHT